LLLRNGAIEPLAVNGMIVGAFPFATYSADTLKLKRGDVLVAFTDGLTEPENEAGEEYGEERLMELLRNAAHMPAKELIERVMNDVVAWTGEESLQDDMTMLVVRKR
jgi:sigma-B regulation protein RsbU (phosphoserine phosphatase)